MEAREFAWNILNRTVSQEAFTGNLLREKRADMKEEDWNLALRIIYGTLSNRRYIRYQWEEFKRGKLSYDVMNLIDLSVYQRLFLDRIPAYAVLDEAIRLVKKENAKMAPVVNAILRNFERRGIKKLPEDGTEALALRTSVPEWLCGLWIAQYGEETAQKLCEDTLRIKPMWVRV
ncbi:MAG: 16S rRNA (cytosine(967)-C(5))-methyltransferase RsmB, partial [Erysipelotrichales bacterium]|nr:16S rRNA (cytosine(967)-C(5))-methyltransferase RsmB [Erysipelotrichales bacterium]